MEKKALAILHFNPIELYPPVINLLNYIAQYIPSVNVYVFTNSSNNAIPEYASNKKNIIIKRCAAMGSGLSLIKRYSNYFSYYYKTYSSLKKIHPQWVWYFETISALPARWYFSHKKFQDTKLLIHYHEYMSPEEYETGPAMVKWIHRAEKKLYDIVHLLSHTNEKRMQMFLRDNQISLTERTHIFPNYPPKSWLHDQGKKTARPPLRIVYVGVIGMDSLYIKEFCEWVHKQNGHVIFHIYSNQDTRLLEKFLSENEYAFISIKGYVPYHELPEVLSCYDIGVILYKGHIPNYVHNAPNKLFEYWACGLDVWFPEMMTGSLPFVTSDVYPKIIAINFDELSKLNVASLADHSGLSYRPSEFYAEKIFGEVLQRGLGIF